MARVDKEALHDALDQLVAQGVIRGWSTRPLGMYWIEQLDGEPLRPDTKEAALWVRGVLYGVGSQELSAAWKELRVDTDGLEKQLELLLNAGVIKWWRASEVGYAVGLLDGATHDAPRTDTVIFVNGLTRGRNSALASRSIDEVMQSSEIEASLQHLKALGLVELWYPTQGGSLSVKTAAGTQVNLDPREIRSWLSGAVAISDCFEYDLD